MFEVNRAEIAIMRMPPSWVVETIDVLGRIALDVMLVMPVRIELELESEGGSRTDVSSTASTLIREAQRLCPGSGRISDVSGRNSDDELLIARDRATVCWPRSW
jgi:hypothetical protein